MSENLPDEQNLLLRAWLEGWTAGHQTGFKSGFELGRSEERDHTKALMARGKRIAAKRTSG